jgi:hypothetical protein
MREPRIRPESLVAIRVLDEPGFVIPFNTRRTRAIFPGLAKDSDPC